MDANDMVFSRTSIMRCYWTPLVATALRVDLDAMHPPTYPPSLVKLFPAVRRAMMGVDHIEKGIIFDTVDCLTLTSDRKLLNVRERAVIAAAALEWLAAVPNFGGAFGIWRAVAPLLRARRSGMRGVGAHVMLSLVRWFKDQETVWMQYDHQVLEFAECVLQAAATNKGILAPRRVIAAVGAELNHDSQIIPDTELKLVAALLKQTKPIAAKKWRG